MANETAKLGVEVTTAGLEAGKAALDALVPAAAAAEKAAQSAGNAVSNAGNASAQAAEKVKQKTKADLAAAAGAAEFEAAMRAATAGLNTEGAAATAAANATSKAGAAASTAASGVDKLGAAAAGAKSKLDNLGSAANDNLNRVQATPANIAAQFQDIGVTAAGGLNPMLIALQQGTQLSAAFAGGAGLGAIGAALKQVFSPMSLLTIGVVALIAYLIQLAMGFLSAGNEAEKMSKELDKVKFASDAVSDSQTILGKVFDLTTGKLKTQNEVMLASVKAQLMVARVKSQVAAAEAKTTITDATQGHIGIVGGPGTGEAYSLDLNKKNPEAQIMGAVAAGKASTDLALRQLDILQRSGRITQARFGELASAVANYGMETLNVTQYDQDLKDLAAGKLSSNVLKTTKPKAPSKAKTPEQKFEDIITGADNRIETLTAEYKMVGKQGDELTSLKFMQELLNQANTKGLTLSKEQTAQLQLRADKMAEISRNTSYAKLMDEMQTGSDKRVEAMKNETAQIGLYGEALYFAQAQARMTAEAVAKGFNPANDNKLSQTIDDNALREAQGQSILNTAKYMEQYKNAAEQTTQSLNDQLAVVGLYDEKLLAEQLYLKAIASAKAQHIELSQKDIEVIRATTEAQAQLETQIKKVSEAQNFARENNKKFFTDWYEGVKRGKSVWDSFVDAITNFGERILDRIFNTVLDMLFKNTGGGNSGGDSSGLITTLMSAFGFAKGGMFGATAFANGSTFTNSVVSSPTAFAFGAGGANLGIMGEAEPEAVMPLKRGADGSLGVQMHGGSKRQSSAPLTVSVTNQNTLTGALSSQDVIDLNQRTAEQTYQQMRRDIPMIVRQVNKDGSLA